MEDKDISKEKRSTIHPLDRKDVLPLLRLLRDPSEPVRTAALRACLLLLPLYPELRLDVENYISGHDALAMTTAAGHSLDSEVQHSGVVPVDSEQTRDPAKHANLQANAVELAASYLKRLEAGEYVTVYYPDIETLRYLDRERATLLVTALFAGLLEAAIDDDQGYTAGNGVVELIAFWGPAFIPDIPALFDIYLIMHEQVLPAREEWYRTGNDYVIWSSTNYLAVSWQLAWTLSRAGIKQVLTDLTASLSAHEVNKRLAAAQLIEDVIRYAPVTYPPQFGGGSGPPGADISQAMLDMIEAFVPPPPEELAKGSRTAGEPAPRYANVNLVDGETGALCPVSRPLAVQTAYHLRIDIGPLREESAVTNAVEFPVPAHLLPKTEKGHWLDVVVTSEQFTIQQQHSVLFLPNSGPSWACGCGRDDEHPCAEPQEFLFVPLISPDDPGEARLRIGFYYENNLLQSQLFTAQVEGPVPAKKAGEASRQLKWAVPPGCEPLESVDQVPPKWPWDDSREEMTQEQREQQREVWKKILRRYRKRIRIHVARSRHIIPLN